MPLQDNSRGGGGPGETPSRPCRSIAEFLGLDTMLTESSGAPAALRNERTSNWAWETPSSPEMAQTPRALVPPACFPPRHPQAYASYSESAQPGAVWKEDTDHGIGDLVSSMRALPMAGAGPGQRPRPGLARTPPPAFTCDTSIEPPWPPEQAHAHVQMRDRNNRAQLLPRRASFCGVVSSGSNGGTALRWTGQLPARDTDTECEFSAKLFLGGLPWDMTEGALMHALRHFQPMRVEWPGRETGGSPRGFAYVTLESERRVRSLLGACRRERGAWFYRLHSRKCRTKEVQVIPWAVSDANWVCVSSARLDSARTVFVGALHGMLSAAALAIIMNDLFSGVVYAGIDTDKNKYPIGSGRVTFDNVRSYVHAISAAFVEIHTDKFTKKVQVDPYLEDSMCSSCNLQQGPYFCREPSCFGYFCRSCWSWQHATEDHKKLMRHSKSHLPAHSAPRDIMPPYNGVYALPAPGTTRRPTMASTRSLAMAPPPCRECEWGSASGGSAGSEEPPVEERVGSTWPLH